MTLEAVFLDCVRGQAAGGPARTSQSLEEPAISSKPLLGNIRTRPRAAIGPTAIGRPTLHMRPYGQGRRRGLLAFWLGKDWVRFEQQVPLLAVCRSLGQAARVALANMAVLLDCVNKATFKHSQVCTFNDCLPTDKNSSLASKPYRQAWPSLSMRNLKRALRSKLSAETHSVWMGVGTLFLSALAVD
ncbi:uncharacterized protein VTP21DRAFT_5516 [Calcarisporiella thermophila]|uniref:uncharacterized protein n=1 Tax=Calcarisporiella thermophila TaxID=911321 RepID=UPI003744433E